MKKMLMLGLLGIVILLCTACPFNNGVNIVTVSGSDKTITREASSADGVYLININPLNFANNNVTVNIKPVTSSELARVEVTYSEELDNYGFDVTIANETISIGADSGYTYDIDTFEMTIYAVFDNIVMGGGGYKVSVDANDVKRLDITNGGGVDCDVSALAASNLDITAGGASNITLSGTVDTAKIVAGGSSGINAGKLICDSANVTAGGSSKVRISVKTTLMATAGGSSDMGYYGTPEITSGSSSTVKQISPTFP